MQLQNFERLEEKIVRVVELIDRLKQENQEISSSYRKLTEQVQSIENSTENVNLEAERLRNELAGRERDFAEKKGEIKRRLESLLEKLIPFEAESEET